MSKAEDYALEAVDSIMESADTSNFEFLIEDLFRDELRKIYGDAQTVNEYIKPYAK